MECFICRPSGKEPEFREYCEKCKLKAARLSVLEGLEGGSRSMSKIMYDAAKAIEPNSRKSPRFKRRARETQLKSLYGISIDDYNNLLASQDYKCAICGTEEAGGFTVTNAMNVDHCHSTGKIRGLLCSKCNIGIGCFDDTPETLEAAAKYLRSFS